MKEITQTISFTELNDQGELPAKFQLLLSKAKQAIDHAYAPYSRFKVGAAVLLANDEIITGSNQENASSPVGICAERVALAAASSRYPYVAIIALAVTAKTNEHPVLEPVSPCGICRQSILEYEQRFKNDIEIILQGEAGKIFLISSVKHLLPLHFSRDNLVR